MVFWKGVDCGSVKGLCDHTRRLVEHCFSIITAHANHTGTMVEFQLLFSSSGEVRSVTHMLMLLVQSCFKACLVTKILFLLQEPDNSLLRSKKAAQNGSQQDTDLVDNGKVSSPTLTTLSFQTCSFSKL